MPDKATLHTEEHHEKADEQGAVRTCTPNAHARAARSNGTVFQWTHGDRSVEIIWRTSTMREVQTICSVPSTGIKLVRYTERGRALDWAARQMVQRSEEDRACRLGEPKRDLLHSRRASGLPVLGPRDTDEETNGLVCCRISLPEPGLSASRGSTWACGPSFRHINPATIRVPTAGCWLLSCGNQPPVTRIKPSIGIGYSDANLNAAARCVAASIFAWLTQ
jgi:hypothetical protein